MNITWKKLRETRTKVGYRTIVNKFFEMPDGKEAEFNVIDHPGAAGVFALTKDKQVIIARQYRPGQERVLDELPGGIIDPDELPIVTAERELIEETGYKPGEMIHLAAIPRDAYVNGTWHYYLALDCEKVKADDIHNDEYEFIEVATIPLSKAYKNIYEGNMGDAAGALFAICELEKRGLISPQDLE